MIHATMVYLPTFTHGKNQLNVGKIGKTINYKWGYNSYK